MNEKELASLVEEMREEFQIPPYYEDKQLANLAKEGEVHGKLFQHDLDLADGDGGGCRWQCLSIQTES